MLLVIEAFKQTKYENKFKLGYRRLFWVLAALCLFLATFFAWSDEHRRVASSGTYVVSELSFSYTPDPFPVGRPAQLNLHWKNPGPFPAHDVMSGGIVYLREHADDATEADILFSSCLALNVSNNSIW